MDMITLLRPAGLVRSPFFRHVAVVPPGATTIHVGGQNAVDATGTLVGGEDAAAQTTQAVANVRTAGASLDDVVSWTVLLVDGVDVQSAAALALATLDPDRDPPLVTAALVAGLGVPGVLVELSAVAAVQPDRRTS